MTARRLALSAAVLSAAVLALAAAPAAARDWPDGFVTGPLLDEYGPAADVAPTMTLPDGVAFKVEFDVHDKTEEGELNRSFMSGARFLNMHARAGVDPEAIALAMVVHGPALADVTKSASDPAKAFVSTLQNHNVRFIVCGQSMAALDVEPEDLLPGVEIAVSAMTAHALLQQEGYTSNPF